jgi:hypothetical protein
LEVAGRQLTGVTVVDLDASIVLAVLDKENVQPTSKGGVGFWAAAKWLAVRTAARGSGASW